MQKGYVRLILLGPHMQEPQHPEVLRLLPCCGALGQGGSDQDGAVNSPAFARTGSTGSPATPPAVTHAAPV